MNEELIQHIVNEGVLPEETSVVKNYGQVFSRENERYSEYSGRNPEREEQEDAEEFVYMPEEQQDSEQLFEEEYLRPYTKMDDEQTLLGEITPESDNILRAYEELRDSKKNKMEVHYDVFGADPFNLKEKFFAARFNTQAARVQFYGAKREYEAKLHELRTRFKKEVNPEKNKRIISLTQRISSLLRTYGRFLTDDVERLSKVEEVILEFVPFLPESPGNLYETELLRRILAKRIIKSRHQANDPRFNEIISTPLFEDLPKEGAIEFKTKLANYAYDYLHNMNSEHADKLWNSCLLRNKEKFDIEDQDLLKVVERYSHNKSISKEAALEKFVWISDMKYRGIFIMPFRYIKEYSKHRKNRKLPYWYKETLIGQNITLTDEEVQNTLFLMEDELKEMKMSIDEAKNFIRKNMFKVECDEPERDFIPDPENPSKDVRFYEEIILWNPHMEKTRGKVLTSHPRVVKEIIRYPKSGKYRLLYRNDEGKLEVFRTNNFNEFLVRYLKELNEELEYKVQNLQTIVSEVKNRDKKYVLKVLLSYLRTVPKYFETIFPYINTPEYKEIRRIIESDKLILENIEDVLAHFKYILEREIETRDVLKELHKYNMDEDIKKTEIFKVYKKLNAISTEKVKDVIKHYQVDAEYIETKKQDIQRMLELLDKMPDFFRYYNLCSKDSTFMRIEGALKTLKSNWNFEPKSFDDVVNEEKRKADLVPVDVDSYLIMLRRKIEDVSLYLEYL